MEFLGLIDFTRITQTREGKETMARIKTLTAKSAAEARGIRKGLAAAGVKFEFKSTRGVKRKKKKNPARPRRRKATKKKAARRRR